ncbi:hypothetical protein DYB30_005250 [Aphanomyces astaci]|uniref:Uncharacterized protein n=1 Tax=Aphanomyces astaci TaxID=112090 RepID=A0A397G086_APHAT|nr:hypothetical protein DYB30_005250 [Aphanomyces astaci]RHZ38385.1 hypothetical protein DYB31_002656 [Aphanomyces astaci]
MSDTEVELLSRKSRSAERDDETVPPAAAEVLLMQHLLGRVHLVTTCGIGRAQEPPTGAVEFDAKILDADSRVSRMLDNLMRVLEADGEEWVLHQEGKLVLEIITKAMKPAPLQVAVSKQQQLQRNMVLKMDVLRYVK